MSQDSFQLSASAADLYEAQKVPAMFGPLADAMLDGIPLSGDDAILDVACGTGIVARKAKERAGLRARVVGSDLNEGMIQTARALTDPIAQACEWIIAPADELPFEAGEFTKVFCQQGLQFFPDPVAAVNEMHRVLGAGGSIFITIWKEPSPFFTALGASIEKRVDQDLAKKSLAPFTFEGHGKMRSLLEQAGFSDFQLSELTVDRKIRDPENSISREILANPVGSAISARGEELLQAISDDVLGSMQSHIQGLDLIVPQTTCLYQARVN